MADLISVLTSDLKEIFPDATTARCERALNLAHADLVARLPELARKTTSTNLTSGTPGYDLAAGTVEVLDAFYQTAVNTAVRLIPMHRDAANREEVDTSGTPFPFAASGTPQKYWVGSNLASANQADLQITLYPTPNTTTSAGYPVLICHLTSIQTMASTDTIPEGLAAGSNYYRHRAAMYLAQELRDGGEVQMYASLSASDMEACVSGYLNIVRYDVITNIPDRIR
jgi:hypothetical protein